MSTVGTKATAADASHKQPAHARSPDLMVVIDHHEAKVYVVNPASVDGPSHSVKPYDPHHFLHHLTHKGESRERGQRAPEEGAFYKDVAAALAGTGRIVVVGHGKGKSNAAHHLTEYLQSHDPSTAQRVVRQLEVDLSSATHPELVAMAKDALR